MITNANFSAYAAANRQANSLYYYLKLLDDSSNEFLFTDAADPLFDYVNTFMKVSPVFYQASFYTGGYSTRPVNIELNNTLMPQSGTTPKRFSDELLSAEFETMLGYLYLGWSGMASESDLIPLYTGRISGFTCNALKASFSLVDRFIFELPKIPTTLITRTSHPNAPSEIIGKPRPLVMGRWNFQPYAGDYYGDKSFIPAYVYENILAATDPQIKLEYAGNNVRAVDNIFIFDDALDTVCTILDDRSHSYANGQVTIDLRTHADTNLLSTQAYLYPDRGYSPDLSGVEMYNFYDGDFNTDTELATDETATLNLPSGISELSDFDLTPKLYDPTSFEALGLENVVIELSCYPKDTWISGDELTVAVVNSYFGESLSYTDVNALSDESAFNVTLSTSLKVAYTRNFEGTQNIFRIAEALDNIGTGAGSNISVIPVAGSYPKMSQIQQEGQRHLNELTDAGTLTNRYELIFDKPRNKFTVKRISGSKYFCILQATGSYATDLGFTRSSQGGWINTEYTAENFTVLDLPDGDFSFLRIKLDVTTEEGTPSIYIKGVRVKLDRNFRAYNPGYVSPRPASAYGRPVTQSGGRDWGRRQTGITEQKPYEPQKTFYDEERTILNNISASRFYVCCDAYQKGALDYYKEIPEMIQTILSDYLGLSSLVNSTVFSAAASDNTSGEFCLYLPTQTETKEVLFNLARYMPGFLAVSQEGKFVLYAKKEEYFAVDVDWTLYPYDIKAPFSDNFATSRTPISQIGKEVNLDYCYNWATGKFGRSINRSTTNDLNLEPITATCEYINNDVAADAAARLFCGTGSIYDFFGRMRRIITFTVLDPEWHLAELGDIVKLSSDFDSIIKVFGRSATDVHYMITAKQDFKNQVVITAEEVQVA